MKPKGMIFDMDGTLLDSMGYWRGLSGEYLEARGVPYEDVSQVEREVQAMGMQQAAQLFIQRFSLTCTPRELMDTMNDMMEVHYLRDVALKPGVEDYLQALEERGFPLCVATATHERLARAVLERLGVADRFRFLLSCETLGKSKRRPDIYLEAARRLGSAPEEIVVYEDALYALRTARQAGFYTVGILDEDSRGDWDQVRALSHETVERWDRAPRFDEI